MAPSPIIAFPVILFKHKLWQDQSPCPFSIPKESAEEMYLKKNLSDNEQED